MEPSTTPPWRVLDAPAAAGTAGAAAPSEPGAAGSPHVLLTPPGLRIALTVGGAVACAVLAFALAFAGAPSGSVDVEGGSALPIAGASGAVDPGGVVAAPSGGEVVVEIVGAVPKPGVYRLPSGSRVGDLIAAAGGYGPRVDTARAERELNLAGTLHDGDQVRVPSRDDGVAGTAAPGTSAGTAGGPIDLNRATQAELESLPGIGPATAQKIIAARDEAPFAAVEELRTRGVLGEKTFEKLRELVAVH